VWCWTPLATQAESYRKRLRLDTRRKYEDRRQPQGLFVCNRERAGYVPNPDPIPADEDAHDVKPIILSGLAVAVDPDGSGPLELPLLPPVYRFDRPAEVITLSGFDLDEGHRLISPDHQIDVPPTILESAIHHDPAVTPKPSLRDPLSQFSERLPGR
jgi:hypothetical protein